MRSPAATPTHLYAAVRQHSMVERGEYWIKGFRCRRQRRQRCRQQLGSRQLVADVHGARLLQ